MKPILFLLVVLQLSRIRGQTDECDDYKGEYEQLNIQFKEEREKLNIAEQRLLEATKKLNLAELKVLQLNKTLEANKQQGPTYSDLQNCPINIGTNSTCKKIRDMGCYCIVEALKSYSDAADYCERNNMKLVAIETREEQELLGGFLKDNLGGREKYSAAFWTSGVNENSDGRWQWTSSKQPLLFRNWYGYGQNGGRHRLEIGVAKPFRWYNRRIKNETELHTDYFICESSAPEQVIKHLTAHVNAAMQDCPQTIGTNSKCLYLDPDGCYCVVLTKSNWIEGSQHCKSQGMELVSIETAAEHSQIYSFLVELEKSRYYWNFWTSALYDEKKSQWVWTSTGQSVNYTNWVDGQPRFNEGEGHAIMLLKSVHNMWIEKTSLNKDYYVGHYICEKNTNSVNRLRDSEMKQKSCSAGSDWTCHNEVTGCYCHLTINRNWADAFALCKSIGMNLVSIESAAEQLLVASGLPKLNDTTLWWTSGTEASRGLWTWTATGRAMNYDKWAVDEPTIKDNSAHAVGMRFGNDRTPYWLAYPLKKEYFPLCEK